VANFDPHDFQGSHWIAIFAERRGGEVCYFDSLNLPTNPIILKTFLVKFPNIVRNNCQYQSYNSKTCGHFCIMFIYYMSIGFTFPQFLKLLDTLSDPDLFVKHFISKLIK